MIEGELNYEFIERKLGYAFTDKSLIDQAFTTKSYAKESKDVDQPRESQESLRTIGDAILKKILIELLLEKGYSTPQQITEKKATLESESNLALLFKNWGHYSLVLEEISLT
jgi:ribonuclease-3